MVNLEMDHTIVIEKVRNYAVLAHGSQMRKYTPEPYMVHPVRVMELCEKYTDLLSVSAAALLHDVLEDTPVTENEMLAFLSSVMDERTAMETLSLVIELTDVYTKAAYPALNRKKRKELEFARIAETSPNAQTIKYADIIDNCREIVAHDRAFAKMFLSESARMLQMITRGNPLLYNYATETVSTNLILLRSAKASKKK